MALEAFTGKDTPLYLSNGKGSGSNVLNDYRSYTYNFTLAGALVSDLSDPVKWRKNSENYIILKSGGKGTAGISASAGLSTVQKDNVSPKLGFEETEEELAARTARTVEATSNSTSDAILGFNTNKNSPGQFDMFIDNVEILTSFSFDQIVATTFASGFSFNVYEPYSMNGFLEALQATALATGYVNYMSAKYVLKMEFLGYPDNVALPEPKVIPETTRYFLINFKEVGIEVTEKGTMYRCTATPTSDMALGNPSKIKEAGSASGITVAEILKDVADKINAVNASSATERQSKNYDKIAIIFPNLKPGTEELDMTLSTDGEEAGLYKTPENVVNSIGSSKLGETSKDNSSTEMVTPEQAQQKNQNTNYQIPKTQDKSSVDTKFDSSTQKFQVQYHDGANVHELIANVIRDSEYLKDLLKTMGNEGTIDEYGYVDYFVIIPYVTYTKEINTETLAPFQRITYVVRSYKVHVSNVPGYGAKVSNFKSFTVREYNYLYTGKNIDVIDFKLNFDALFALALPVEMNNETLSVKNAAGADNSVDVEKPKNDIEALKKQQIQPTKTLTDRQSTVPVTGPGLPRSDDPYRNLARNFHTAMLNSTKSMAAGELVIIGDPVYIATSGQGNINPGVEAKGFTVNGEVNHTSSQIPIRINFRNPIDIGENGWYRFSEDLIPFSGIYTVLEVRSIFAEGIFKQRLKVSRIPGQVEKPTTTNNNFTDTFKQFSNPFDQVATDSTDAKTFKAGTVSSDVLKRLGAAVQTNLGTAATALAAGALISKLTKNSALAVAGALVTTGAITATKNALATANTLGSSANANLVNGVGTKVASASNVAPADPVASNVEAAAKTGVAVDILDKKQLENLPATQAPSVAPGPQPDPNTLAQIVKDGGPQALARAYGVKDVSQISPDMVSPDVLKTALDSAPTATSNFLSGLGKAAGVLAAGALISKISSANKITSSASPTPVNITPKDTTQPVSVGTQYGSNSTSPVTNSGVLTGVLSSLNNTTVNKTTVTIKSKA